MSGTSMATPHVAGAAAIVKQAHPDWTGAQLKAALVSSADTAIPGDVRATGGGRLEVMGAASQAVTSTVVQGGTFDWPHTSSQVTTVDVPVHQPHGRPGHPPALGRGGHRGRRVRRRFGARGPRRPDVTVPAHATVTVPLRVNPAAKLTAAQYGDVTGRVVATGGAAVSTPFSLYVAPATVDLTIRMKDRLGSRPPAPRASTSSTSTRSRAFATGTTPGPS